ncbi:MAG: hypothetical protein ACXAC7_13530 [Candidatus Hodarchaeales archaeon]
MNDLDFIIYGSTFLFYLITLTITFRLWLLIRNERYWIGFPLATISFALHEVLELYSEYIEEIPHIFPEIFELIGSIFMIYAAYGLSKILIDVNKNLEKGQ